MIFYAPLYAFLYVFTPIYLSGKLAPFEINMAESAVASLCVFLIFLLAGREIVLKTYNAEIKTKGRVWELSQNVGVKLGVGSVDIYVTRFYPGTFLCLKSFWRRPTIILSQKSIELVDDDELRALLVQGCLRFKREGHSWRLLGALSLGFFILPYLLVARFIKNQYVVALVSFFYYPFLKIDEAIINKKNEIGYYDTLTLENLEKPHCFSSALVKYFDKAYSDNTIVGLFENSFSIVLPRRDDSLGLVFESSSLSERAELLSQKSVYVRQESGNG